MSSNLTPSAIAVKHRWEVRGKVARKLPQFLKKYFWDVEFKELDREKSAHFILKRILEYGDEKATVWMRKSFTKRDIKDILTNFRGISPRSANYWATIFGIDKRNILCLQKPYLERQKTFWPY